MKIHDQPPNADRVLALQQMPYQAYLQTPEWRRRRNRALARATWRCEWPECGSRDRLGVHHRRYAHLGAEPDEDLCVLCYGHHHAIQRRADGVRRLHWRVIRDVINSGAFDSIGHFVEAVKVRFHTLRIDVDPYALNDMLNVSLQDVAIDAPDHPVRVSVSDSPAHISETEAREVLARLKVLQHIRTMTAVRELSPEDIIERHWLADQRKAYLTVQQQILEAAQRAAAFEAAIEPDRVGRDPTS